VTPDDLVTAALLGTARRSTDPGGLPGRVGALAAALPPTDDAAARLLDGAALLAVARRAGAAAAPAPTAPPASPHETTPRVSAAAGDRLTGLLGRTDTDGTELLTLWLRTAAANGLRAPAATLPALLDLATRTTDVRGQVAAVLGERGRWLAAHRRDWAGAVDAPLAALAPTDESETWTHGTPAQRTGWFTALRAHDPVAARALLAEHEWSRETAAVRASLVRALGQRLDADDEPLLVRALGDRSQEVRAVAVDLLSSLPTSAFAADAGRRSLACITVERRRLRQTLVVTLPEPEPGDPFPAAPQGQGVKAWLLGQLVAAAPLDTWTRAFGATPAEVLGLRVADDLAPVLHEAWATAAVRQGSTGWALALLPLARASRLPALVAALDPAARAEHAGSVVAREPAGSAETTTRLAPALRSCEGPWPHDLTHTMLRWLARRTAPPTWRDQEVLHLLGHRLPAEPEIERVLRERAGSREPDDPWRPLVLHVADTVHHRRQILEELR
jgi:hypothetical protein